jgi:hypothetical protein
MPSLSFAIAIKLNVRTPRAALGGSFQGRQGFGSRMLKVFELNNPVLTRRGGDKNG